MNAPFRYAVIAASCLLALLFVAMVGLFWYVSQNRLPVGLRVSGWAVGGMTFKAFDTQLHVRMQELGHTPVQLRTAAYELPPLQTTYAQLGMQTNAVELRQQLERLRRGTPWERAGERWRLHDAALELRVTLPEAAVKAALRKAWKPLFEAKPVNARRVITGDDRVTYEPEQSVPRVDAGKLSQTLLAAAPKITELVPNRMVMIQSVPLVEEAPRISVQSLKAEGIERKLIQFTTQYMLSSPGRQHNIESTAATVHDMYLKPGEIFDYAKVIEDTKKKYGYREAPVIVNGKIVPGVGGGICQVSTTLYNAVLRSGLEVVERRNHSLPISYAPLGQDATFSTGYINFRFRNNTAYGLLIRMTPENGQLTVKLFGNTPENVTYDIESKIVKTIEPPIKYVRNQSLSQGEQRKLMEGQRGFVVETSRVKKQNGKVIGTELVSRDTYMAQPTIIGSNTGTEEGNKGNNEVELPPQHVEDGIEGPKFN